MEPWDGPASVTFTDGTVIGAVLDRNGLRPSRYWVTDDDLVIMASEVGVIDIDPAKVVSKGRLQPGRMFLIDTAEGRIVDDEEIKTTLAAEHPYGEWLDDGMVELTDLPEREHVVFSHDSVLRRQQMFGYTHEELKIIVAPMAARGVEPIGSMGTDTPIAVLSDRPRLLFDYFPQLFAQVTNPPLDAIREEVVTSVSSTIGPEANLLGPARRAAASSCCRSRSSTTTSWPRSSTPTTTASSPACAPTSSGVCTASPAAAWRSSARWRRSAARCRRRSTTGARIIVLSDRNADAVDAPIPSLLLTAAVHHHLVRTKQRTKVGLVVECGDAREVHHMALLIGYGAGAINPYLAFESIEDLIAEDLHGLGGIDPHKAVRNYIKACGKGVLKVMSKMGVSTVASYTGAQIFEAIGLGDELVEQLLHRHGQPARRHRPRRDRRRGRRPPRHRPPAPARRSGPTASSSSAASTSGGARASTTCSTRRPCSSCSTPPGPSATTSSGSTRARSTTSRAPGDAARAVRVQSGERQPVPIDEVEPVGAIVRRFSTGR